MDIAADIAVDIATDITELFAAKIVADYAAGITVDIAVDSGVGIRGKLSRGQPRTFSRLSAKTIVYIPRQRLKQS